MKERLLDAWCRKRWRAAATGKELKARRLSAPVSASSLRCSNWERIESLRALLHLLERRSLRAATGKELKVRGSGCPVALYVLASRSNWERIESPHQVREQRQLLHVAATGKELKEDDPSAKNKTLFSLTATGKELKANRCYFEERVRAPRQPAATGKELKVQASSRR